MTLTYIIQAKQTIRIFANRVNEPYISITISKHRHPTRNMSELLKLLTDRYIGDALERKIALSHPHKANIRQRPRKLLRILRGLANPQIQDGYDGKKRTEKPSRLGNGRKLKHKAEALPSKVSTGKGLRGVNLSPRHRQGRDLGNKCCQVALSAEQNPLR